jgi:Putative Flp pilus-assembly TadE/G-like
MWPSFRLEHIRLTAAFRAATGGNVTIILALSLVPMVGAIGMAVDYSRIGDVRTKTQSALDTAVLAGLTQSTSQAQTAAAGSAFKANVTAVHDAAPTATFAVSSSGVLSGTAQATVPMDFLGVFGIHTVTVALKSAAMLKTPKSNVCILLVADQAAQALLANSGATINAPNCEIHVRSSGSPAAMINSGTALGVKRICVKGTSVTVNGSTSAPIEKSCAAISDPFAGNLPTVSVGACDHNNLAVDSTTTRLDPGVYCGWTNFNGSGAVTLKPGLYVIQNGGMTFNSSWTVTGTGVTFYLVDQNATLTFNGGVNATLSAPTSGTYSGILMFEPAGLPTSNLPINGSSGDSFQGLIYLPSRAVTINSVSNVSSDSVSMVFYTLILDTMNWTFTAGSKSMSVPTGSGSPYLVN